ncbi:hypothetical protein C0993_011607, partial [Termitomyces sp. T159_Od127]
FTTFIVCFKKEAYETSWNYNALQFAPHCTLPQCIKDILHLALKQPNYNSYKALITQINQWYWEDRSMCLASWAPWNFFRNSQWQTKAVASNQATSTALLPTPATQPLLGQGLTNANQPLGPHPLAQLNAADMQEALDPNQANNNPFQDPP